MFFAALILIQVIAFLEVCFYRLSGYSRFLTSLFPVIGIIHTLAVAFEFRLSRPYTIYEKAEELILLVDLTKFLMILISVLG